MLLAACQFCRTCRWGFVVPRWLVQVLHPPQWFENPTIAIFKDPLRKIIIQIKLVGMSMIFLCTKPRLTKCDGSWVLSKKIKCYIYFSTSCHVRNFLFFHKIGLIENCSIWRSVSMQNLMLHLTGESFACTSEVKRSSFSNGWSYGIKIMASKLPSMARPPYWISWKPTSWFKSG
jgi:hypothetical protein